VEGYGVAESTRLGIGQLFEVQLLRHHGPS
jgi:hypothetical protein